MRKAVPSRLFYLPAVSGILGKILPARSSDLMRTPSASQSSEYPEDDAAPPRLERLQKVLAAAGVDSRRHCEELITTGRVTVDGKVMTELGAKVDPERQRVCLDGERIKPERKQYYLINKPKGFLCTNDDPSGRPRVVDLLPPQAGRLFTVGRLDENTEGLLLVTNDGEVAQRLAHPRFQVERHYRVQVAGDPAPEIFDQLKEGFYFTEGKFRVREVRRVGRQGKSTILQIVLTEGQNREVRRLFARVGHKVLNLKRIAFGPLKLADLETGEFRKLNGVEIGELLKLADGRPVRRTSSTGAPRKRATKDPASPTSAPPRKAGGLKPIASRPASAKTATPGKRPRPAASATGAARPARRIGATGAARPAAAKAARPKSAKAAPRSTKGGGRSR